MKDFSVELFNQDDENEFKKFRTKQHADLLQFYNEVLKDVDLSTRFTDETFELIRLLENKQFKSYKEINKFLAVTAGNKLLEYRNYEKIKQNDM